MSKKSRKQRGKKQHTGRAAKPTPAHVRPTESPIAAAEAQAVEVPVAATAPEVRPEEVVGAIVEQIVHALEEALPALDPDESKAASASKEPDPAVAPSGTHATRATEANRRRHPRMALTIAIDLSSESHFFSGLSGDVSEGGVFVETYLDIPRGSDVALQFELPNGSVHAHGSVKWHRDRSESSPPGVGIEFTELSDEAKALVIAFCARRAPLYYEVAS
jgi:uncharacterized protein (TIGR02266 family)